MHDLPGYLLRSPVAGPSGRIGGLPYGFLTTGNTFPELLSGSGSSMANHEGDTDLAFSVVQNARQASRRSRRWTTETASCRLCAVCVPLAAAVGRRHKRLALQGLRRTGFQRSAERPASRSGIAAGSARAMRPLAVGYCGSAVTSAVAPDFEGRAPSGTGPSDLQLHALQRRQAARAIGEPGFGAGTTIGPAP